MKISDTTKYFIHANLSADGVVERSDVVGAIFGQTEGLLGDDLDLRDLQKASKISRMEVDVESEEGSSYGTITIGSSLDKVETAVLAAALETIERIGPCTAEVEVELVEDVRTTKRKQVVERAKQILSDLFDDSAMDTEEILKEVRETVRAEEITTYAGLPAGPNLMDSDAVLIVEGRSDVLNLLRYGVKNAVGVEGTDVPEEIAELSRQKTVTVFLDGDRGGELILKELGQVADIDYVAHPPDGGCVEDLSHREVTKALRDKVPYDDVVEGDVDGGEVEETASSGPVSEENGSLGDIFESVHGTSEVVLLDAERHELSRVDIEDLKVELEGKNGEVEYLVLDGEITQRTLDIASMGGVETVVGDGMGYVAKKPLDVNIVTDADL